MGALPGELAEYAVLAIQHLSTKFPILVPENLQGSAPESYFDQALQTSSKEACDFFLDARYVSTEDQRSMLIQSLSKLPVGNGDSFELQVRAVGEEDVYAQQLRFLHDCFYQVADNNSLNTKFSTPRESQTYFEWHQGLDVLKERPEAEAALQHLLDGKTDEEGFDVFKALNVPTTSIMNSDEPHLLPRQARHQELVSSHFKAVFDGAPVRYKNPEGCRHCSGGLSGFTLVAEINVTAPAKNPNGASSVKSKGDVEAQSSSTESLHCAVRYPR